MNRVTGERELLDEQEALARAGIQRAVHGLGVDLMDALSLPAKFREHEAFETAVTVVSTAATAAAGALSSDTTLRLLERSLVGGSSKRDDLRGILRRACLQSVLALTTPRGHHE